MPDAPVIQEEAYPVLVQPVRVDPWRGPHRLDPLSPLVTEVVMVNSLDRRKFEAEEDLILVKDHFDLELVLEPFRDPEVLPSLGLRGLRGHTDRERQKSESRRPNKPHSSHCLTFAAHYASSGPTCQKRAENVPYYTQP